MGASEDGVFFVGVSFCSPLTGNVGGLWPLGAVVGECREVCLV